MALWEWTSQSIVERFNSFWANLITISPWWSNSSNVRSIGTTNSSSLIDDEFLEFLKQIPLVKNVSPYVNTSKQLIYWTFNSNIQILWVASIYKDIKSLTINDWTFLTDEDILYSQKVIVLWNTIAKDTFWNESPIWKEIKLQNVVFNVIWVLWDNSQTNNRWFIPVTTAMWKFLWTHYYWSVDIQIDDTDKIEFMTTFIEKELMNYLQIKDENDFPLSVSNLSEIVSNIQQVTWTFTLFLSWIAAISLIVGWIGVMNIMLVSVTERTREIWIRKAIWATKNDILMQFLIEALILSLFAWAIWVILSIITINIINSYIKAIITTDSIIYAVWSVVFIWIVFWILPAIKASRLKPIEALRFE